MATIDSKGPQKRGDVTITGSASDTGSDLDAVMVRIGRLEDESYWDGSGWVDNPNTWQPAIGTTTWSLPISLAEGTYEIVAYATDISGNMQRWDDHRPKRRIAVL